MKALAYLLGATALTTAREADRTRRPVPEPPLEPLATTEAAAAAWRRWSRQGEASALTAGPGRLPSAAPATPTRAPA
jgi:hypothetical protein